MGCNIAWASRGAAFDVAVYRSVYGHGLAGCADLADVATCSAELPLEAFVFVPQCSSAGCPPGRAEAAVRSSHPPAGAHETPAQGAVVLHRGGYEDGAPCSKCVDVETARFLAARGVVAVAARYRLRGDRGNAPAAYAASGYANRFGNPWVVDPAAMYLCRSL